MFCSIVCALALALAGLGSVASFAEDDTKVPSVTEGPAATPDAPKSTPEPDTSAQRSGKLWVCCDDGRQRWTATPEVCRQRKGQLLPSRFCERATTVCCRTSDRGEWMNDIESCARAGGEASDARYCNVCCKQGRAEWWMPDNAACHRDGGVVADASYCR